MLRLKSGKVKDPSSRVCANDVVELVYEGSHDNGTTTLRFTVTVNEMLNNKFVANVHLSDDCEADTIEGALERLASWCQRASEAIKDHKFKKKVPT